MLSTKKLLYKIMEKGFFSKGDVPQGATVAQILALPSGIYSNGNKTSNLPTNYGVLIVFDSKTYYKGFLYLTADYAPKGAIASPTATTLTWH